MIDALAATGIKRLEVTSFVRARRHPSARRRGGGAGPHRRARRRAAQRLVPNRRGLDRALGHRERFHEVGVFVSASETHNRRNVNRSVEESLGELERMIRRRSRPASMSRP